MAAIEESPSGLQEILRRVGGAVLAIFHNRLELLLVELHADRLRLFQALLLVGAIVALGFFTLTLLVAAIIVLTWNWWGVIGLFVLSGLGLIATLLVFWRLCLMIRNWPLLPGTLEQLKKDRECLDNN